MPKRIFLYFGVLFFIFLACKPKGSLKNPETDFKPAQFTVPETMEEFAAQKIQILTAPPAVLITLQKDSDDETAIGLVNPIINPPPSFTEHTENSE